MLQHWDGLRQEIANVGNVQAVQNAPLLTQIAQQITAIDTRSQQIEVRVAVGNNNAARALNALARPRSRLTPLVADAGQDVPGFPASAEVLWQLPVGQVNTLLAAYNLPPPLKIKAKRILLLKLWGLQTD